MSEVEGRATNTDSRLGTLGQPAGTVSRPDTKPGNQPGSTPIDKLRVSFAAAGTAVMGVAPHLLHHAGPLAGAAVFAGIGGTLLFGALGFALAIPLLLRLHRRHGSWRLPAALLTLFAGIYVLSALVLGPALTAGEPDGAGSQSPSQGQEAEHDAHH